MKKLKPSDYMKTLAEFLEPLESEKRFTFPCPNAFPCPYYPAEKWGYSPAEAEKLFAVLDAFPKDHVIAKDMITAQPSVPTWKRTSGRLVVTFFEGTDASAREYVNRYGDCGTFTYPWTQAPGELLDVRAKLAERYGFAFKLCYLNYYTEGFTPIHPHADREDVGTLFPIATVSLGAERPWSAYLRDHDKPWPKHIPCHPQGGWKVIPETHAYQIAESGSLLVMEPGFQETHIHAVLPTKLFDVPEKCGPRISLTFRHPTDKKTLVVNRYKAGGDLYVGRGSEWGNLLSDNPNSKAQYVVKPEEVMPKFREWFRDRIRNEKDFARKVLTELRGKTLECYCDGGKPCHAAIMASWADLLAEKSAQFKGNPEAAKEWLKHAPY